jgi:anti-sigma regulatory factor (Ser/Thr protein kinase)
MKAMPVSMNVLRRTTACCPPATHILAELPYLPSAVPQARRVLRQCLRDTGLDDDASDTAELLVSELVTNAVKYGRPPVWLLVELRPGLVHATVSDTSTALPERREIDDDSEGGRGLLVLDALAGSWGAVSVESGKYLWFDMAVALPTQSQDGDRSVHPAVPVPEGLPAGSRAVGVLVPTDVLGPGPGLPDPGLAGSGLPSAGLPAPGLPGAGLPGPGLPGVRRPDRTWRDRD